MTERERFFAVLNGEQPDQLPWYADLSYLYTALMEEPCNREKYGGEEGYLRFHREMGAGIYLYAPSPAEPCLMEEVCYREEERDGLRRMCYKTPLGDLTAESTYLPAAHSYADTQHFVKTIEDVRIMTYIFEHTFYRDRCDEFSRVDRLWGEDGFAMGLAPISVSPLQCMLARWAGVQTTIELLCDEEEEMDALFQRIYRSMDGAFEILCKSRLPAVEFAENLSSEIVGLRFFRKYNAPWYGERIAQLHQVGTKVGIHIDGTLNPCLGELRACGFDFAEAVTPLPVGDLAPEELRGFAGEGIVLFGGLPGALFSPVYSDEAFQSYLQRVVSLFGQNRGYVLGVADQVPPDGILERVKAVRACLEQAGRV